MTDFNKTKELLWDSIDELLLFPKEVLTAPGKNFTRCRKIPFQDTVRNVLLLGSSTLDMELLDFFGSRSPEIPTSSAFVQQRNKIRPEGFSRLLHIFTGKIRPQKLYKGYRLVACDGTDISISRNANDKATYLESRSRSNNGCNLMHLNAMYDITNNLFLDAAIKGRAKSAERCCMNTMVDRYPSSLPTIFMADRGYESLNVFAHIIESGRKFLIRVKDTDSNGLASTLPHLKAEDEFDVVVDWRCTKSQSKEAGSDPAVKIIGNRRPFDYIKTKDDYYDIRIRFVRFKISEDQYECIATNLPQEEFTVDELKELYHKRWGIETAFRFLKYVSGLKTLHSKKTEFICQEIFAALVMYNFCSATASDTEPARSSGTRYPYRINFSMLIRICTRFLKRYPCRIPPFDVDNLIKRYTYPDKGERSFIRNIKRNKSMSLMHRS
ncbi:MAG: IS4 family transposase [Lachnospiraceae bacterium]|nr:IS4 family transposase [Lachnospiraceae bacterium]